VEKGEKGGFPFSVCRCPSIGCSWPLAAFGTVERGKRVPLPTGWSGSATATEMGMCVCVCVCVCYIGLHSTAVCTLSPFEQILETTPPPHRHPFPSSPATNQRDDLHWATYVGLDEHVIRRCHGDRQ